LDTRSIILAVASPPGRSARGIVRLSGARTFLLLRPHLTLRNAPGESGPVERGEEGPGLESGRDEATERRSDRADPPPFPRGAHRGVLTGLLHDELPCLALIFHAPHSYTGEHSVELQLPGNALLLGRVVDALIDSTRRRAIDARRAEAGEFTARAFLGGKMTLAEAEGVAAMIAAQSDAELRAARLLSTGKLAAFARSLSDRVAAALALVEAGIDFTDQEDVVPISPADLYALVTALHHEVHAQMEHAIGMEQLEAIPWVVLTGAPNAGKSTLFNALLGRERAVVSDIAGTTRDVLAEPLTITTDHGPAEVMLIDLAGSDLDESALNRQMQTVARQALDRAELIIRCVPVNEADAPSAPDEILVRTKADLADDAVPAGAGAIPVSAVTGRGLDGLVARIADRLADRAVSLAADALALQPRHDAALRSAVQCLAEAGALIAPHQHDHALTEPELVASTLRQVLDHLAVLSGDVTADDVLGRIFASFCVGK
jgi:tRNA modification GTPase